jgi:hypothetical protein
MVRYMGLRSETLRFANNDACMSQSTLGPMHVSIFFGDSNQRVNFVTNQENPSQGNRETKY